MIHSIYTDGASSNNEGGWGVIAYYANGGWEAFGGHSEATNQQMELTALIEAKRYVLNHLQDKRVVIYTDSKYAIGCADEWMDGWKAKGWRKADGKPVKNLELIQELDSLSDARCHLQWVKGHSGNVGNDVADQIAVWCKEYGQSFHQKGTATDPLDFSSFTLRLDTDSQLKEFVNANASGKVPGSGQATSAKEGVAVEAHQRKSEEKCLNGRILVTDRATSSQYASYDSNVDRATVYKARHDEANAIAYRLHKEHKDTDPDFYARFFRECVNGSAIAPEFFSATVKFIEDFGYWEPNRALNHKVSTFYQTRKPHSFGKIAMFLNEDGSYWQGKPENPRLNKKGEPNKYEAPVGVGACGYLPPVPGKFRKLISDLGVEVPLEGSFWQWLEQHPGIPVVITEGAKKALSLLSQGIPAIALFGVNSGVLKNDKIGDEKVRKIKPELVPGLKQFAVPGREFIITFDQDEKIKTRQRVTAATGDLAFWLERSGCKVKIASWNKSDGKGVDDVLAYRGFEFLAEKIDSAPSYSQWKIERRIAAQLTRTPHMHIGTDEFVQHNEKFPTSGIVALSGGKGTGKGKAIAEMLKGQRWLSVTTLRSLGRDQAEGWGGVFVQDGDRYGDKLLKDGEPINGGSVCIPSLLKVKPIRADVLVLDELPAILDFLLTSKLANKDGIRPLLLEDLARRIREAELVICASADLTEECLRWVEDIRGEQSFLIRTDRKPLGYPCSILKEGMTEAVAAFIERVQQLEDGKIAFFHSDCKALCEKVSARLLELGHKSVDINSDTSGGEIESSFLQSKGRDIPSLIGMGVKAVLGSPSVKEGFSVEHHTDLIDSVWGIFQGGSITAHGIAQTCDRVRALTPRFLWIAERGRAYSELSKAETITKFMHEFEQSSKVSAQLVRHSLTPFAESTVDTLDFASNNLRMVGAIGVERNRGMRALRDTVVALLRKEGKQITYALPEIHPEIAAEEWAKISEVGTRLEMEWAIAREEADSITDKEAESLKDKDALTPEEQCQLDKYYLEKFYRIEGIKRHEILWDRKGQKRSEIRHLEAVLNPDLATEVTAKSINDNPSTPQDWNRTKAKQEIIRLSGGADLIRDILEGRLTNEDGEIELPDDRVKAIADFLKKHKRQVEQFFGNINKVSDRQAAFLMLDWVGLKRGETKRARVDGKLIRRYFIDTKNLEKLQSIINRRSEADPPPLENNIDQGGGSPVASPVDSGWQVGDRCFKGTSIGQWRIEAIDGNTATVYQVSGWASNMPVEVSLEELRVA